MAHGLTFHTFNLTRPVHIMLFYTFAFLVIAIGAGVIGFTISGIAAVVAKACFAVFVVLFLISIYLGEKGDR